MVRQRLALAITGRAGSGCAWKPGLEQGALAGIMSASVWCQDYQTVSDDDLIGRKHTVVEGVQ